MSNSLWPHGLQHARLPCPSTSPRVCSNSCPLSQWCHTTISSSVASFSSRPQSFPASGSFPVSWPLHLMAKVLELQFQHQSFQWISGWFPLGLTGLISLLSKEPLKSLLQHDNSKPSIVQHSAFFMVQLSHPYKTAGKTIALIIQNFFGKVMSLLFNMLPRFVIPFLPRNKCLLILWPKSTVCRDFGDQKNQPPPHLFGMKWWIWMPWS